jgi:hypothetical protein
MARLRRTKSATVPGVLTKVYLYIAARRGGNYIYALDVTDRNAPKFSLVEKYTKRRQFLQHGVDVFRSAHRQGESKHKSRIDLRWRLLWWLQPGQRDKQWTAIGEDADPAAACPGSGVTLSPALGCGNRIFVVDAFNGTEIHSFPSGTDPAINKGVAADVSLVDSDADGYVDRIYAVDVGGSVWRMDVDNALHAEWKLFNVANVTSPRKFLYSPEFVLTRDFTAVLVGSGDREKPLKLTGVDRFYMFKDKKTGKDATGMVAINGDDTASNNMVDITGQSSPPTSAVITGLASSSNNGWFYELVAGEKVVNAPLVVGPVVYFSTNKPTPVIDGTCTANLGEAKAYGCCSPTVRRVGYQRRWHFQRERRLCAAAPPDRLTAVPRRRPGQRAGFGNQYKRHRAVHYRQWWDQPAPWHYMYRLRLHRVPDPHGPIERRGFNGVSATRSAPEEELLVFQIGPINGVLACLPPVPFVRHWCRRREALGRRQVTSVLAPIFLEAAQQAMPARWRQFRPAR